MLDLGFFVIDLSFFSRSTGIVIWDIFISVGWFLLAVVLSFAVVELYKYYKALRYTSDWKHVVLAIDVPAVNIQTPKAVEQLFSHIFSVMDPPTIASVFRRGFMQNTFSFEIISIEGYIQFLVRTLDKYRDVVEAAVYAQYAEAEITEVEDYVKSVPDRFPNDTHDIWAADYLLTEDQAYPIRTYEEFEHSISKDTIFKDPMGTILESFSRIGVGEQVWFQIIIEPIEDKKWKEDAIKKIKELIGEKVAKKTSVLNSFSERVSGSSKVIMDELSWQLNSKEGESPSSSNEKDDGPKNEILYLTPGQKKILEAMEDKIRKIGFVTKIRLIYVAEKKVFNPSRAVNSFTGALNQFNIPSSNSILPKYITSVNYFFKEQRKIYRKNILMRAYKTRDKDMGRKPFVLNIEELATLWHFPMSHVKTPLLQKSENKATEPPSGLPVGAIVDDVVEDSDYLENTKSELEKKPKYTTDSGLVYDDDNEGLA